MCTKKVDINTSILYTRITYLTDGASAAAAAAAFAAGSQSARTAAATDDVCRMNECNCK